MEIRIGKLGVYEFPKAYYVYCGSAHGPGGIYSRVGRHLTDGKKLRWHVDYAMQYMTPVEVWVSIQAEKLECAWSNLLNTLGGEVLVAGFGSSDCSCPSHLLKFNTIPVFGDFQRICPAHHEPRCVVVS